MIYLSIIIFYASSTFMFSVLAVPSHTGVTPGVNLLHQYLSAPNLRAWAQTAAAGSCAPSLWSAL